MNRPIPGGDVEDHAQRRLSLMSVLEGGRDAADLRPLVVAKMSAIDAIGKRKFLDRDLLLNRYLTAVPVEAQDGVRRLEYLEWENELVEVSAMSGGAA